MSDSSFNRHREAAVDAAREAGLDLNDSRVKADIEAAAQHRAEVESAGPGENVVKTYFLKPGEPDPHPPTGKYANESTPSATPGPAPTGNGQSNSTSDGVWGDWPMDMILGWRGDMPIVEPYQALQAAESHVATYSPFLAKAVRAAFDAVEVHAKANRTGWLWRTGRRLFTVLGFTAHLYLRAVGQENEVSNQYAQYINAA